MHASFVFSIITKFTASIKNYVVIGYITAKYRVTGEFMNTTELNEWRELAIDLIKKYVPLEEQGTMLINTLDIIARERAGRIESTHEPVITEEPVESYSSDLPAGRIGNACYYHGVYYKSVVEAERATGVHRYWINKYCQRGTNGWHWA